MSRGVLLSQAHVCFRSFAVIAFRVFTRDPDSASSALNFDGYLPTVQLGLPTFRNVTVWSGSHRKKRRRLNRQIFVAAGPPLFLRAFKKKCPIANGGGWLQFLTRDRPLGSVVALTHLIAFTRVGRVSPSRHPSVDVSSDLRRSFEQGFFQLPTVKKRTHHVCLRPRQHAGRPRAGAPPG